MKLPGVGLGKMNNLNMIIVLVIGALVYFSIAVKLLGLIDLTWLVVFSPFWGPSLVYYAFYLLWFAYELFRAVVMKLTN